MQFHFMNILTANKERNLNLIRHKLWIDLEFSTLLVAVFCQAHKFFTSNSFLVCTIKADPFKFLS